MTQTQKFIFEIPILVLMFWIWQSFELSFLQIPWRGGALQLIPVVLTYVALTRSWTMLTLVSLLFLNVQSFTSGYSAPLIVALGLWTALMTRLFAKEFAVEGRWKFSFLAIGAFAFNKLLVFVSMRYQDLNCPLSSFIQSLGISSLAHFLLAYAMFPFMIVWDEFFGHEVAESRDLNPGVLR